MEPQSNQQKEIEKLAKDYQIAQEQLRMVTLQLDQLKAQKAELDGAKEQLEKATGKTYSTIGGIMVETDKAKALEDVKDRSELTQARLQSINKQYTELRAKEKDLNAKIADIYKGSQ